jgi:serine/threonine protein kinase
MRSAKSKIGAEVAALAAAHRSIIHRDIKPSNIMVSDEGCEGIDFGLAARQTAPAASTQTTDTAPVLTVRAVSWGPSTMSRAGPAGRWTRA